MEVKMNGEGEPKFSEEEIEQMNQKGQEMMTDREKMMTDFARRSLLGPIGGDYLKLEDRMAGRALREKKTVAEVREEREREISEKQNEVKVSIAAIPDTDARSAVQNRFDKLLPYLDFLNENPYDFSEEWDEKAKPFFEPAKEAAEMLGGYKGDEPYQTNPEVWVAEDAIREYKYSVTGQ